MRLMLMVDQRLISIRHHQHSGFTQSQFTSIRRDPLFSVVSFLRVWKKQKTNAEQSAARTVGWHRICVILSS